MSTSKPTPRSKPEPNNTAGVVERGKLYVAKALYHEMRWKTHSVREAKRRGMPVIRFGSRDYVVGAHFIDWFSSLGQGQP